MFTKKSEELDRINRMNRKPFYRRGRGGRREKIRTIFFPLSLNTCYLCSRSMRKEGQRRSRNNIPQLSSSAGVCGILPLPSCPEGVKPKHLDRRAADCGSRRRDQHYRDFWLFGAGERNVPLRGMKATERISQASAPISLPRSGAHSSSPRSGASVSPTFPLAGAS